MITSTEAPSVPEGTRVYAIGDIHGRADLLSVLLRKIESDAADAADLDRRLIFLGDYVDRWPLVPKVIDILLDHLPAGFAATFLRGNHEQMMLDFLNDPDTLYGWVGNGGDATLDGYGIRWTYDPETVQARLLERMPERHQAFLSALELSHTVGDYLFVHAGIRPGIPLDQQSPQDMMWVRNVFLNSRDRFGKMIVHGHTIVDRPEFRTNRIGIDTGAVMTGRLTCLVLQGHDQRLLST